MEFWQYLSWVPDQNLLIVPVDAYLIKKKMSSLFSAQKVKKSSDSNIGVYTIEKCFESVIKSASFIEIPRKIYSFENPHVRLCSFCSDQRYRPDTAAGQFPGFLHLV